MALIFQSIEQLLPITVCGLFVFTTKEFLSTIELTVQRYKQKSLIGRLALFFKFKYFSKFNSTVQQAVSRFRTVLEHRQNIQAICAEHPAYLAYRQSSLLI